jgi:hypothetical protein
MTQQIEVEPTELRAPVHDPTRADPSKSENAPHSPKRIFITFIVALVFAFAVIVGLIYMVILRPTNPRMTPSLTLILFGFRGRLQDGFSLFT